MAAFLDNLTLIADFVFGVVLDLWQVICDSPILLAAFGLWVLRKLFDVFGLIKG